MTFYEEMAATASELLAEFGAPVVLERVDSDGVFDPVAGTDSSTTKTLNTTGLSQRVTKRWRDELGPGVENGDSILVLDPGVKPEIGDKATIGALSMAVVQVVEVSPAGIPLIYFAQVRQ
jgi:hypothetical protein